MKESLKIKGRKEKVKRIFSILFALVLVLSFSLVTAVPAGATDYNVNPGGDIQAAVNGATSGDTIILNDGTFSNYTTVTVRHFGYYDKGGKPWSRYPGWGRRPCLSLN